MIRTISPPPPRLLVLDVVSLGLLGLQAGLEKMESMGSLDRLGTLEDLVNRGLHLVMLQQRLKVVIVQLALLDLQDRQDHLERTVYQA